MSEMDFDHVRLALNDFKWEHLYSANNVHIKKGNCKRESKLWIKVKVAFEVWRDPRNDLPKLIHHEIIIFFPNWTHHTPRIDSDLMCVDEILTNCCTKIDQNIFIDEKNLDWKKVTIYLTIHPPFDPLLRHISIETIYGQNSTTSSWFLSQP